MPVRRRYAPADALLAVCCVVAVFEQIVDVLGVYLDNPSILSSVLGLVKITFQQVLQPLPLQA